MLTWLGWLTICPALGFPTLGTAAMVNRAFFGTIDPSFWVGWVIMIASLLVAIAVFFILERAHLVRASIRTVCSVGRILALRWRCDHAAHRQPRPGDLMETLQDRPGVARRGVAKSGRIVAATIPQAAFATITPLPSLCDLVRSALAELAVALQNSLSLLRRVAIGRTLRVEPGLGGQFWTGR